MLPAGDGRVRLCLSGNVAQAKQPGPNAQTYARINHQDALRANYRQRVAYAGQRLDVSGARLHVRVRAKVWNGQGNEARGTKQRKICKQ